MATVVLMPKVGISVESCIITKWHKNKGDTVNKGDILFSYETDKASVDEEAAVSGTMLELFFAEGDDVPVMQGVCVIGEPGEDVSAFAPKSEEAAPAPAEAAKTEEKPVAAASAESAPAAVIVNNSGNLKVSPRAKSLADKFGVDLRMAAPTGPEGRIIERDVRELIDKGLTFTKAAKDAVSGAEIGGISGSGIGGKITVGDTYSPAAAPAAETVKASTEAEFEAVKMPNIRKLIAKSMQNSLNSMAQLTLNASFDATELMNFRASFKNSGAAFGLDGVTLNDMMLFAVSRTLKNHKTLNAHLVDETMYYFRDVNLGIAVDTERGLMVPTLFAADKKSLAQISKETKQLISDCQKGSVNPDYLKGGTFTVTNLGSLGVESFTPVINPPQTGILGVCAIEKKVKEVNGQFKSYSSMGLSLTFDHRAIDGAPAAKFLKDLKANLENFSMLLAL